MQIKSPEHLNDLLYHIALSLDIPSQLYEAAVRKYEDVGSWLASRDSALYYYGPEIYPQGSFLLGTMTKPTTDIDEYDIDLVCRLNLRKEQISQAALKQMVGNRLRKRKDLLEILEEGRRCWTLTYPLQFHMDLLPAIPNHERPPIAILLTDTQLLRWQKSNPKAYADWFHRCMITAFEQNRAALARSYNLSVEEVPHWEVKTPLQRAIQILKRHRNLYFQENPGIRPASIIITTLAAEAYRNQMNVLTSLIEIVHDMPKFIRKVDGKWLVTNPVDPEENFADKWNEDEQLCRSFFTWFQKVDCDLKRIQQLHGIHEISETMGKFLGSGLVRKAVKNFGNSYREQRQSGNLRMATGSGVLCSSGDSRVKNHTFYGS